MKILITGANGFIGKNLIATLNNIRAGNDKFLDISEDISIYEYDMDSSEALLEAYCEDCDFVYNLAGVNRPIVQEEFMEGNFNFGSKLLGLLKKYGNTCPVMLSSSTQAELNNPYGQSKKAGEILFFSYADENKIPVYVYRFPNIFGKWCKPNYNSAVATFCHNIANDLPIHVNDENVVMNLVYVDDVISELIGILKGKANKSKDGYCSVKTVHTITLKEIINLLYSFKRSREEHSIPDMSEHGFVKKLYSTYLTYLPTNSFCYPLKMNIDERGSFTEIFRTQERGQFSVNVSRPEIAKGNHWHHTKNEKFVVVSGRGVIRFRKIDNDEIIEYHVSGEKIEVVDIPPGFTHIIINVGDSDLVTIMWCSECFDPERPDTYFLEV